MDSNSPAATPQSVPALEPGDYYIEGANLVFTAAYHLKRGSCCNSGCRHCPYGFAAPDVDAADAPEPPEPFPED
jgi:hypothetical protein